MELIGFYNSLADVMQEKSVQPSTGLSNIVMGPHQQQEWLGQSSCRMRMSTYPFSSLQPSGESDDPVTLLRSAMTWQATTRQPGCIYFPQRQFHEQSIVMQQQMSFLQAERVMQMAPVEEQMQLSIMSKQKAA